VRLPPHCKDKSCEYTHTYTHTHTQEELAKAAEILANFTKARLPPHFKDSFLWALGEARKRGSTQETADLENLIESVYWDVAPEEEALHVPAGV